MHNDVSPTKYKYQAAKFPAILDFYHKCQKSEMTLDCVDDFIYPYRICKIAIFVFLSICIRLIFGFLARKICIISDSV